MKEEAISSKKDTSSGGALSPLRRRTRSSSTASSANSFSSLTPSPSHSTRSSSSSTSSSIPFSWERQPGVPKNPGITPEDHRPAPLLPLPPPLRSTSDLSYRTKKKSPRPIPSAVIDPFAAALAACAASDNLSSTETSNLDHLWRRGTATAISTSRAASIGNRLSLFAFHGSCKAAPACGVARSTVPITRTGPRPTAAYAILSRTSG